MRRPLFKIKNRKTTVFLICLGIAAFFWFLIKLSKEYEMVVNLPVEYANFPKDKILISKPDSMLLLKVSGNGFDLISYSLFGTSKVLEIDVADLKLLKTGNDRYNYYLLTKSLTEKVNNSIKSKNFTSILQPDSLVLKMEILDERKVIVVPSVSYMLSPQYQLKRAIYIKPDSISIYGIKRNLKEIDSIITEKIELGEINKSIIVQSTLKIPSSIKAQTSSAAIHIEVEKFTESSIGIPIKSELLSKKNIKVFPARINIKYAVSLDKYKDVTADDFSIEVLEDSLVNGRIHIHLKKHPSYVRIIDFSPKIAEYIITQ